ncbi:MAG TPA: hypothetical protein VF432_16305 [Thermoanaerobaculia bacterium]
MGTSASYGTPSGGEWSSVKRQITATLGGGNTAATPATIVGGTTSASGGLSYAGGAGGAAATSGRNRIAGAIAGIGGFGAAVRDGGLDSALSGLGLDTLRGRPAAEVVSAISEYLAREAEGLDREFLQTAFSEALLEAASLGDDLGYEDFATGLEEFLAAQGAEGLVELFLDHFVFDTLWGRIEQHAVFKSSDDAALESLMTAIQGECVAQVREQMDAARNDGSFATADWFGRAGQELGMRIVSELEARLSALRET